MNTAQLSDACAAMNRAKKLPVWDNLPHALHVELDIIFRSLSEASAARSAQILQEMKKAETPTPETADELALRKTLGRGTRIRVTKDVKAVGAMMPKTGTEGVVINASKALIVCEFATPYELAGGGRALHDPEQDRGIRVYLTAGQIEVIPQ